ncbi:hypothetical protein GCM10020221_22930 [Streptomyces thioluteus]|uniref:KH domain-containing protein n=1 Tax=Streptomyces thioluteus TaxID=66431 RepID=A0ABP6J9P5_STRTU
MRPPPRAPTRCPAWSRRARSRPTTLEGLLDIADLDGDIDMDVEADRASVSIISESTSRDLQKLVGRDGEVLEALQELTRLAVNRETGDRSRLMLDIAVSGRASARSSPSWARRPWRTPGRAASRSSWTP